MWKQLKTCDMLSVHGSWAQLSSSLYRSWPHETLSQGLLSSYLLLTNMHSYMKTVRGQWLHLCVLWKWIKTKWKTSRLHMDTSEVIRRLWGHKAHGCHCEHVTEAHPVCSKLMELWIYNLNYTPKIHTGTKFSSEKSGWTLVGSKVTFHETFFYQSLKSSWAGVKLNLMALRRTKTLSWELHVKRNNWTEVYAGGDFLQLVYGRNFSRWLLLPRWWLPVHTVLFHWWTFSLMGVTPHAYSVWTLTLIVLQWKSSAHSFMLKYSICTLCVWCWRSCYEWLSVFKVLLRKAEWRHRTKAHAVLPNYIMMYMVLIVYQHMLQTTMLTTSVNTCCVLAVAHSSICATITLNVVTAFWKSQSQVFCLSVLQNILTSLRRF